MQEGCVCEDCKKETEAHIRRDRVCDYDFIDREGTLACHVPGIDIGYISRKNDREYTMSMDFNINFCCVCGRIM